MACPVGQYGLDRLVDSPRAAMSARWGGEVDGVMRVFPATTIRPDSARDQMSEARRETADRRH